LVSIKGPSGKEQKIQNELKDILTGEGATVVLADINNPKAPCNLVMEIPGTGDLADKPGIMLNAHVDTISRSTPEYMIFDANTGDFYHLYETESGKSSSFGGDDRSAVAAIVETIRKLQADYWARGIPHRRILFVFTADEERGLVGARYLSRHRPDLFDDLQISLTMDGPLDFNSDYPQDSFVAVVSDSDSEVMPYKRVTELIRELCGRSGMRFGITEVGLGMGDFAAFPAKARAGLHLRSPVRGLHTKERVKVQDLINHIDLLCYILLGWDNPIPEKSSDIGK
jgi:putative aminopeptidase FrvX